VCVLVCQHAHVKSRQVGARTPAKGVPVPLWGGLLQSIDALGHMWVQFNALAVVALPVEVPAIPSVGAAPEESPQGIKPPPLAISSPPAPQQETPLEPTNPPILGSSSVPALDPMTDPVPVINPMTDSLPPVDPVTNSVPATDLTINPVMTNFSGVTGDKPLPIHEVLVSATATLRPDLASEAPLAAYQADPSMQVPLEPVQATKAVPEAAASPAGMSGPLSQPAGALAGDTEGSSRVVEGPAGGSRGVPTRLGMRPNNWQEQIVSASAEG
jgi:hypothetical protein